MNADADDAGPLLVPLLPLIEWLLPMGGRAFGRAVGTSALTRAGRHRLLRNAIAALGNAGELSPDAVELLERARDDRRDEVREQAARTLRRPFLGGPSILSHDAPCLAVRRPSLLPRAVRNVDGAGTRAACRGRPRATRPGWRTSPTSSVRRTTSSMTPRAASCWTGTIGTRYGSSTAPCRTRTRRRQRRSRRGSRTEPWNGVPSRRSTPTGMRRHRHRMSRRWRGSSSRVLLEPWGGGIRPHEHTMPGPKADRLALLGATRTQLSPILAVYFDRSQPSQGSKRRSATNGGHATTTGCSTSCGHRARRGPARPARRPDAVRCRWTPSVRDCPGLPGRGARRPAPRRCGPR